MTTRKPMRTRFYAETGLAASAFVLLLVTLVNHEWIELVFRVDPDGGDGSLEWLIVAVLAAVAVIAALLARFEWRRGVRAVPDHP